MPLVTLDGLESVHGASVPAFVHREHRWTLTLLRWAQMKGHLPIPSKLVVFDAHHDALPPRRDEELKALQPYDLSIPGTIGICNNNLSINNDDWITAGMELGIISDAVVFGVQDRSSLDYLSTFPDSRGGKHHLFFTGLPGRGLAYQGDLSDLSRDRQLSALWNVLGWEPGGGKTRFRDDREKFAFDFDLDCFTVSWNGYTFPWPEEVWENEFQKESDYPTTRGWTGVGWLKQLKERAGMITFATEPRCCGGDMKVNAIWNCVNGYLFAGNLVRSSLRS